MARRLRGLAISREAFGLVRANAGGFFRVLAPFVALQLAVALVAALLVLWLGFGVAEVPGTKLQKGIARAQAVAGPIVGALGARILVGTLVLAGAMLVGIAYAHARAEGRDLRTRDAWRIARGRYATLAGGFALGALVAIVLLGPGIGLVATQAPALAQATPPGEAKLLARWGAILWAGGATIAFFLASSIGPAVAIVALDDVPLFPAISKAWARTRGKRSAVAGAIFWGALIVGLVALIAHGISLAVASVEGPLGAAVPAATYVALSLVLRGAALFVGVAYAAALLTVLHRELDDAAPR